MPGFSPVFGIDFFQVTVNNQYYFLVRLLLLVIPIKQLPEPQQRGVSVTD